MRDFLRGCLVWFVGYPLSVVAATAVLLAPLWATSYTPVDMAIRMLFGAAPVVGFFALLPALLTSSSPRVWPYVAAGTRTGAWGGALMVSIYAFVLAGLAVSEIFQLMTRGQGSPDAPEVLMPMLGWIVALVALFAVAGAAGGFVFGLVAAEPAGGLGNCDDAG